MTSSPNQVSRRAGWLHAHRTFLTCLLLMLAAWLEYAPSLQYDFVYYDDVRILRNHPELYGQINFSQDFKAIFVTCFPREEPLLLRDVSWAVDSRMFGFPNPFGYHLGNVLLQGLVVPLLYCFLLGNTQRPNFALAVTVGFLILGIHTEPVAWIMGRKDILSALFMLLALCAQTRRLTTGHAPARWGWYLITLAAFACGVLSKISVLSFPVVLLLHSLLFPYLRGERPANRSFDWDRTLAREVALFLPAMAFSIWIYLWYAGTIAKTGLLDRGYTAHGLAHLWNLLMVNPLVLWVYLQQTFFPSHLKVFYAWPGLTVYPAWQIAVALGTVAALLGIGLWLFRRHKDLFFYFAAFFILMVPYANLQYIGIWVAERYLYFSSFCLLALAVTLGAEILRRPRPLLRASVLALGLWTAGMNLFQTHAYQPAWRNGMTLWQYHLLYAQSSPGTYENLAAYYYAQITPLSTPAEITRILHKVAVVADAGLTQFWPDRRQPPPPQTYYLFFLRSLVEEMEGMPEQALNSLLISDQLHPGFDATNLNLARLYHSLAGLTKDTVQQERYAAAARDRFSQYILLAYRGRTPPPDLQKELADYEAQCSGTNHAALPVNQNSP
jgi:hypothetical protein